MDHETFVTQIRQALEHLHDFAYLQNSALIQALSHPGQTLDQSVRGLRAELLAAIEHLKPDGNLSPRAKEQRPYVLLYGRYVQGLDTPELVDELAISLRQLRREQKRALDAITDLLWERLAAQLASDAEVLATGGRRAVAEVETEQLITQAQLENFELGTLIEGVLSVLTPVADKHQTQLHRHLPNDLPSVRANHVILRQALLSLMSYAIDCAGSGHVSVSGISDHDVQLEIKAIGGHTQADARTGVGLDVSQKLIASLGGRVEISETAESWQVTLHLPLAEDMPIMIIDDNAGLIDLFRRYLAGRNYRVVEAHTIAYALQAAEQTPPSLIVLDVMMPEQDGWEVLQHLRVSPITSDIPIVICSVLNEPEIAEALGASDYLLKPVTQDALLSKVEQWCRPL